MPDLPQVAVLRREYQRWERITYPPKPHSHDLELSEAWEELVLEDEFLAGLVSRLSAGKRVPAQWRAGLRLDGRLLERLTQMAAQTEGERGQLVEAYLEYMRDLGHLSELAVEAERALRAAGISAPVE